MNEGVKIALMCFIVGIMAFGCVGRVEAHMTDKGTLIARVVPEKRQVRVLVTIMRDDVGTFLKLDKNGDKSLDASELKGQRPRITNYINEQLQVSNNSRFCSITSQKYQLEREVRSKKRLFLHTVFTCEQPLKRIAIQNKILFSDVGGYKHIGRIQVGKRVMTTVFSLMYPTFSLELKQEPVVSKAGTKSTTKTKTVVVGQGLWQVFKTYVYQGIIHILIGTDHILFVIALLVAARNFRQLALVITAFTVGHSFTLILSVLGWISVPQDMTEVFIAVTIAYVVSENLAEGKSIKLYRGLMWGLAGLSCFSLIWLLAVPLIKNNPLWRPLSVGASMILAMGFFIYYTLDVEEVKPAGHRFWLTCLFGLIHGVGFSFVLQELKLPKDSMVSALLSFNVGVEVGQIAIVLLVFPMLMRAKDHEKYPKFLITVNTIILVAAIHWVVTRTFGIPSFF